MTRKGVVMNVHALKVCALLAVIGLAGASVTREIVAGAPVTREKVAAVARVPPMDPTRDTLSNDPHLFTSAGQRVRVVATKGLSRPFALAFLPNGDILITERAGRLRIVRAGVLDPQAIAGIPDVLDLESKGLQDVAIHPRFAQNNLVYFTYYKRKPGTADVATAVLARGRFDGGHALTAVADLFVAGVWVAKPSAARIAFAPDGTVFMSIGVPIRDHRAGTTQPDAAQDPASVGGKILRLTDEGRAPLDNPFVGRPGYRPEIYALGIRNAIGLVIHPKTGALWEHENGPLGGDEINVIQPGHNYGWPVVSRGRDYTGERTGGNGPTTAQRDVPGMDEPFMFWDTAMALSGLTFYTGDAFPAWKGDIFVGGRVGTKLQRLVVNEQGMPAIRESLLLDLHQRIAEVRQGPDGRLYLLTDQIAGALLTIEPVPGTAKTVPAF
jgi:glucose/arabinose dehydrogenase